jgi:hypothetical protein
MADAIHLLERQYQRLRERDGVEFWRELPRFYEMITTGPRPLVSALAQLRERASAQECAFRAADTALIPELVELRNEFVRLAPEADDSGTPRPGDPSMGWNYSLANFDQLASGGPDRLVENIHDDDSASATMLRILQSKLNELRYLPPPPGSQGHTGAREPRALGPELDDLSRRLRNIADRHQHEARKYQQGLKRHGGFQVELLDMGIQELNPEPREVRTDEDHHRWANDRFLRAMTGWDAVGAALAGHPFTSDISRHQVELLTEKMKAAADAVYEDLRYKLVNAPRTYVQRLAAWVVSPGYGFVAGPCAVGIVTAVAQNTSAGLGVFVALAAAFALLPPIVASLPTLTLNASLVAGAVLTATAVAVVFVTVGFAASVLAGALMGSVFLLGRRSPA